MSTNALRPLHALFALARTHGEEGEVEHGATHEVGDLQDLCEGLWLMLTPQQQRAFLASDVIQELRAAAGDPTLEDP